MFKKKEFKGIYEYIKNNQKSKAQNNLKLFREKYSLDPDYLYLMAEFLILEKRFYQAIDTIHVSLLVENDDEFLLKNNFNKSSREVINKKFKLLSELFKIIDIPELYEEVKNLNNPNDQNIFFQKMQKLMPGISFNKLK
tara:strand:- start:791 stop:1207 length:417 start_codon:yes stop_codon:yes gene_type:complete